MNVVIAGDFRLRAGDLIFCDFAALDTRKDKKVDDQISGIYDSECVPSNYSTRHLH